MRARIAVLCVAVGILSLSAVVAARADEPGFVRWLVADDPGDETIRDYWERAERDELAAAELVDLGTMVFYRGFPKDALKIYKSALDIDPELYEAWFRMGLAEHTLNDLDNARQAYRRCLKQRPGHAWCNFYLGLLEEQLGHSSNALMYFEKSFTHAPQLSDPKFNPAVLSSRLVLGARLRDYDQRRFEAALPMSYLQPAQIRRVRRRYEPTPTPVPEIATAEPEVKSSSTVATTQQSVPQPTTKPQPQKPPRSIPARRAPTPLGPTPMGSDKPNGSSESSTGASLVPIGNTSDEAHLMPWWPRLSRLAFALV